MDVGNNCFSKEPVGTCTAAQGVGGHHPGGHHWEMWSVGTVGIGWGWAWESQRASPALEPLQCADIHSMVGCPPVQAVCAYRLEESAPCWAEAL